MCAQVSLCRGVVYIGTGSQRGQDWGFGDMDDILVRSQEEVAQWARQWPETSLGHIATIDSEMVDSVSSS